MTKVEAIIEVLKGNGGAASWSYIYNNIERYYPKVKASENWQAGIRGVLLRELYKDKYFKRIDAGVYALSEYNETETLEGERDAAVDIKEILRIAKNFSSTAPSHKIKTNPQKVRIESRAQKERIAISEGYACQLCGWSVQWEDSKGKKRYSIDVDHITPKEDGGDEEINNLWALCPNCHRKKTLGVIVVDQLNKQIFDNGKIVPFHHNVHLWKDDFNS